MAAGGNSPAATRSVQSPNMAMALSYPSLRHAGDHRESDLPGLNAPLPCLSAGIEMPERRRDFAREFIADLMARGASPSSSYKSMPLRSRLRGFARRSSPLEDGPIVIGKRALRRQLHQRVPIVGGIILRGSLSVGSDSRGQCESLTRHRIARAANPPGHTLAPIFCNWPSANRGACTGPDRR